MQGCSSKKVSVFSVDGQAAVQFVLKLEPRLELRRQGLKLFLGSIVLVFVPIICVAQAPSAPGVPAAAGAADRKQIIQLEKDWAQSFVTMDVSANERIVADDYLGTETDGRRVTKADLIAEFKTGDVLLSNRLEDDVKIRFYGDTAIVNGTESWKRKSDGKTGKWIWTDVFVKRHGKWQVVASQDLELLDKN
jgi:hypothetical protein